MGLSGNQADFVRVLDRLGIRPDSAEARRAADMLGLELRRCAPSKELTAAGRPDERVDRPPLRGPAALPGLPPEFRAAHPEEVPVAQAQASPPGWFSAAVALDAPGTRKELRVALEPLFRPQWLRALVVAALSTVEETGELDLEQVIDWMAHATRIERVPLRRARTLRRGLHCWIDSGAGVEPFIRDQDELELALERIAGRDRVTVHVVDESPRLPPAAQFAGAPVLVLSDLGVNRVSGLPSSVRQAAWLRFALQAREQGAAGVVAFVPGDVRAIPAELRRAMAIVPWDRATSVHTIGRARRNARG